MVDFLALINNDHLLKLQRTEESSFGLLDGYVIRDSTPSQIEDDVLGLFLSPAELVINGVLFRTPLGRFDFPYLAINPQIWVLVPVNVYYCAMSYIHPPFSQNPAYAQFNIIS